MRRLFRAVRLLFAAGFKAEPRIAALGFFMEPAGILITTFSALWLKLIVDGVTSSDNRAVLWAVIGLSVTTGVGRIIGMLGWRLRTRLLESTGAWLDERILHLTAALPGLEHHERPDYHDRLERLHGAGLGQSIIGVVGGVGSVAHLVTTTALLATLHPVLIVLPAFGIPSVLLGARAQQLDQGAQEAVSANWRRSNHFYGLAIQPGSAKELRVFGLDEEIRRRHGAEREEAAQTVQRAGVRGAWLQTIGWVAFAIGYIGAIGLVAVRATRGEATLGDVMLGITLAGQVNGTVEGLVDTLRWLMRSLHSADQFLWLEDMVSTAPPPGESEPPMRLRDGIRLEGVSFTYPGTETPVLEGVDLHLPAGARVALVGDNGVGKTTLVKLLCGFYEPTAGRITVDGVDLAAIHPVRWREQLSAAFQDYCRFEFLARETVGVGDLSRIEDLPAVDAALARAGAEEIADVLPSGLETLLGRSFDGGIDVSMGQWQKLALGRAFMRDAPLVLMLDEPTASLDAKTEHGLFRRYAEAARARAAEGAITLLVSHRFSTVRNADLIVVVAEGRIAETGSHQELLARGGLYAELFTLQASAYR